MKRGINTVMTTWIKKRVCISALFIFCLSDVILGQNFAGGGFTLSTYFGDISPFSIRQSWASLHPGAGFYFSKQIRKPFYLDFDIEHSTLSGKDASSNDLPRKMRNLSFTTPITSFAVSIGARIPLSKNENVGISGGLGGSLFKFNPKALFDGKWYKLQPLSTEGQGLAGGPKTYSLFQWAIPVHGGIFIKISHRLKAELVISQYFTKTDYLDDVSGNYFDPVLLTSAKGEIAYHLSYRTKEVNPDAPEVTAGSVRGNPKRNDQFVFAKVGVSYKLENKSNRKGSSKPVKCPVFK